MKKMALGSVAPLLLALMSAGVADAASIGEKESGLAAVYSNRLHGRITASGHIYDKNKLTAAHKTLPFGSKIKVTNDATQQSVEIIVNDRGPVQQGRILDLSPAAAKSIGMKRIDLKAVTLEVIEVGDGRVRRR